MKEVSGIMEELQGLYAHIKELEIEWERLRSLLKKRKNEMDLLLKDLYTRIKDLEIEWERLRSLLKKRKNEMDLLLKCKVLCVDKEKGE